MKAIFYPDIPFNVSYFPEILEEIYIKKVYDEVFTTTLGVVLDCGANCGLATGYFRDHANKVYSFEPDPDHFEALTKNKEYNKWDNVEILNAAVADKDGEATFHVNGSNRTASSLDNPFYESLKTQHQYNKEVKIKTITLDKFIEDRKIDQIDFLKMDIEGQEDVILESAGFADIAPKIKSILVEFHNPNWERLVTLLESFGFTGKRLPVNTVSFLFRRIT